MKKFLLLLFVLVLFSCLQEGYIVDKIKTDRVETYYKKEIMITEYYFNYDYDFMNDDWGWHRRSRIVGTGKYNYYKFINNSDCKITIMKNNDKKEVYIDEKIFNNLKNGQYVYLEEYKDKYSDFDYNNKTIEISEEYYFKNKE